MKLTAVILGLAFTGTIVAAGIHCPADAPAQVRLAAKEVRRYVYLRTGKLLVIGTGRTDSADPGITLAVDPALGKEAYRLKSDGKTLGISGGSETAVLYGAYAFAGKLGVRFELHGDVIPDAKIPWSLPQLDETHEPLFELRGIQPFHDFLEGPDWWNADDYKAYASQMVKMKMNFIGLHSYPWHKPWTHVCPEPGIWIGLPEDVDAAGKVKSSYPASWANTMRTGPGTNHSWGHLPGATSGFTAGAAMIFDRDDYGADVMRGLTPWPKSAEDGNMLFNRVGEMFKDAFGFARKQGVKVCVGTETPFWVPDEVRAKLKAQGKNPDDPAVLRELCKGMLQRIQRAYPVDYFWLWTPERELDVNKTTADLRVIHEVAREMNMGTAVSGWGWLAHNFANIDKSVPKDIAFSCINDKLGFAPVTSEFGKLDGRQAWCIPWMEDDTNMTAPQLFAGRVRKDAADARKLGCTGLMGIHWRTKAIAPTLDMLALSGWQSHDTAGTLRDVLGSEGTVKPQIHPNRALPTGDFYADWCLAQFGPVVAHPAAVIFSNIDGQLPRPACWALHGQYGQSAGPGVIGDADSRSWETVAQSEYAFVDAFAALRPRVVGAGNLDRFDYWLGQFQYLRAMGKLRCRRFAFDQAVQRAETTPTPAASESALQARSHLVAAWTEMMTSLLETVSTPGEMGTVANLELHTRLSAGYLTNFDRRLEKILGKPLPVDQEPPLGYAGKPRLIVPTNRSVIDINESLGLKIIALAASPVRSVSVRVRAMGTGDWQTIGAGHVARAVWQAKLPAATDDFEYQVIATGADGARLHWPATAPDLNQTVIVTK